MQTEKISERIARYRANHGLTQAQMGDLLQVSRNYIGMIEGGQSPSRAVARLFEMIEREDNPRSAPSALNAEGILPSMAPPSALNAEGSVMLCEEPATYGERAASTDDLILPAREAEPLRALARESHCNAAQLLVFAVRLYIESCRREGSIRVPIAAS